MTRYTWFQTGSRPVASVSASRFVSSSVSICCVADGYPRLKAAGQMEDLIVVRLTGMSTAENLLRKFNYRFGE